MNQSSLKEIAKIAAKYYGLHPDCMSNTDNSEVQQKARQVYMLLAVKLGYTVAEAAKVLRRESKQAYHIVSAGRKNRRKDENMQMCYSICLNVLLLKGEKIKGTESRINYEEYEPFVQFTPRERAAMAQAQIDAQNFMKKYGACIIMR